jgi:hypothetical protein
MPNKFRVDRFSRASDHSYDLLVATIGYEKRSRAISEQHPAIASFRKLACGFTRDHVLNYDANRDWFSANDYVIAEPSESEFSGWFQDALRSAIDATKGVLRIRLDISSMTRTRLAQVIEALAECKLERAVAIDFVYALAEYSAPPPANSKNTHVGPVTTDFSGWWTEPDRPVTAVVGLGYEENKALGALEHIQASDVWLFLPRSPIAEYSDALRRSNRSLLEVVKSERLLSYQVEEPFLSLSHLESLCSALSSQQNVILLPFGPKIFVLISLLVARLHYPDIAVWRVSGSEDITDRSASQYLYGLRVIFSPLV